MKRILTLVLVCSLLTACGNDKTINGTTYGTFGLMNDTDMRNPNVQYEVSFWSVFWAVVLCETVIVPIYVVLFDLYQPVRAIDASHVKGKV